MVGERCCCCERVVISRVGRHDGVLKETVVFVWWKRGGPILDSKNYRNGELQSPTEFLDNTRKKEGERHR